eukprot:2966515-Pyramimonas_sp.AAC.1
MPVSVKNRREKRILSRVTRWLVKVLMANSTVSASTRENIPGAQASCARRERIFPERKPTARVEREYSRSASQSRTSRENIPGAVLPGAPPPSSS